MTCPGIADGADDANVHCNGCARISTLEARIAELTAASVRLDLEIEWFERLIEEDGARGCDVDLYRSLLHKLRQVRGDIPSRAPSREEMDRFFADALKESNHDLLRKDLAAARDRIAELERELAKPENWPLEALTESNNLRIRGADLEITLTEAQDERDTARADRDEAVRQMREALNGFDKQTSLNCWREYETGEYVITARSAHEFVAETRKLLLALHPAQPETPNEPPPKNGETE